MSQPPKEAVSVKNTVSPKDKVSPKDPPVKQKGVRLQKYLAECGIASRRRAEVLIERGRVSVNEKTVTELGTRIVPGVDQVRVKGRLVLPEEKGIILLNKPRSVVTTMDDPEGRPTVADYISKKYASYFPVGRLDWDSTGLVIMTNDGELAEKLLHPRYSIERTYEVLVQGSVSYDIANKVERGVMLEDGLARGKARVIDHPQDQESDATWLEVTLTIGKNRIVRRMFEKLGHPVIKLHRVKHGPFKLGPIRSGGIKKLSEREYQGLRRKVLGEG